MALAIILLITIAVYYTQLVRMTRTAKIPAPMYIAKPDWYSNNMEWRSNQVLYDGGNLYYNESNTPKTI